MTAAEAKIESSWRSLPPIIRVKIERATEWGEFTAYFYKSVTPDAFRDIDTTLLKLQLLGYKAECSECYTVNAADLYSDPSSTTTDTKLTINW